MTFPENNILSEIGKYWMEGHFQCLVFEGLKVISDGLYLL